MRGAIFLKVNFQHYLALGHNRNIRHESASGDAENKIDQAGGSFIIERKS